MAMEKPNRLLGSPLVLRTTFSVSRLKAQHVETKTASSGSPGTILTSVASDQVQKGNKNSGASLRTAECPGLSAGGRTVDHFGAAAPPSGLPVGTPRYHTSDLTGGAGYYCCLFKLSRGLQKISGFRLETFIWSRGSPKKIYSLNTQYGSILPLYISI